MAMAVCSRCILSTSSLTLFCPDRAYSSLSVLLPVLLFLFRSLSQHLSILSSPFYHQDCPRKEYTLTGEDREPEEKTVGRKKVSASDLNVFWRTEKQRELSLCWPSKILVNSYKGLVCWTSVIYEGCVWDLIAILTDSDVEKMCTQKTSHPFFVPTSSYLLQHIYGFSTHIQVWTTTKQAPKYPLSYYCSQIAKIVAIICQYYPGLLAICSQLYPSLEHMLGWYARC